MFNPCYPFAKCLRTRVTSGNPPRQSVEFFTSITSMDRVWESGNASRSACYEFLNTLSTLSFKSELVGFEISTRSNRNA